MATSNPVFKGHSASWIAGWKEADRSYDGERLASTVDQWLQAQYRIDHDAWIWIRGMLVGCLLVISVYWIGKP